MPIAIAVTVLAMFGLTTREKRVDQDKRETLERIRVRAAAAADSACQAELALAPNDSVRIVIVDRCVARRAQGL